MSILSLPFEILKYILEYTHYYELPVLSQTCKKFYQLVGKRSFVVTEDLAVQSPELLVWAMTNGYRISYGIVLKAVLQGNVELLRLIFTKKKSFLQTVAIDELCNLAVRGGQTGMLKALRNESLGRIFPWSWVTCHYAMEFKRIDILRQLRDGSFGEKCPLNKDCIIAAVHCNSLEAIRYYRSEGIDWYPSKAACIHVAKHLGYSEIAQEIESGKLD